jgi:diguanylate cyclase (GGDEF)-like protein
VIGDPSAALATIAASSLAGIAQSVIAWVARRFLRLSRASINLARLAVALLLATVLIELVIPASFSLYIPVVGLAAAIGLREGLIVGTAAAALYVLPVLVGGGASDGDLAARGVAGAAVCALVAGGARYYVGTLERATAGLRRATARERRRVRQIAGIEQVGQQLAAGATKDALSRVMDVLVERFGYQYVSIYLSRAGDNVLVLGAQRGYQTPIDTFDGSYGVVGRIMRTRRAELVPDVSLDPDYVAANPDVQSEISAPLIVAGEFLGMVNVESGGRLDETDLRLVSAVADRLASYVALGLDRERLAELSVRDPLTGLHNRRHLDESLDRLFAARARQAADKRELVSVILFDLDRFGALNKEHGVAAGDAALRRFGRLLAERFRQADIVARYGGEEFLVVLLGSSLDDAERRADDVRAALASASDADPDVPHLTVSAGCACLAGAVDATPADLVARADVALSMAKRSGRNRVVAAG